jgi:hypothetical protein
MSRGSSVPQPKFKIDDEVQGYTITGYLTHSAINYRKLPERVMMTKEHHWYVIKCPCGFTQEVTQQELIDTRRTIKCPDCQRKSNENPFE